MSSAERPFGVPGTEEPADRISDEEELRAARQANRFDIRRLIGAVFIVYGVILTILGIVGSSHVKNKAAGININLWTGIGMLIFGAFGYAGLGPSGGAAAMLIYFGLGSLAFLVYLWGKLGVLKPSVRIPKLSLGPALAVLRVGGMSAVVSSTTNLTLAIVTAYVGKSGIEALAGYGAGSRLEFLLVPLAYGVGGPVGILISANLGAGRIERAVKASWIGLLMACAITEAVGLAAAIFPEAWVGLFSQDPAVLKVCAEYLHRVGPFFGFFGVGYALYCIGQGTRRMEAAAFASLLRAAIAVFGGLVVVWLKADVIWNFAAVSVGMVAFGLFALPPLIRRVGFE